MAYVVAEHRSGVSWMTVLYLLIGLLVAANRGYLAFGTLSDILSAVLGVLLWPLLLLGFDLHLALGM